MPPTMSEPRIKSGLVNELFADADVIAFDKLSTQMMKNNRNFVPFDPDVHSCDGAIIQSETKFFADTDNDRYATFKNALKNNIPLKVQTVRFAQWRAELTMEKSGRVVVKRSLRVSKKEIASGGSPMIVVLYPGLNNAIIQSHLDVFKNDKKFEAKGNWLECSEEIEVGAKEFMNYVDVFRHRNELEQLDREYL